MLLLFRVDPLPYISYSLGRADMHILALTLGCVVMHAFGSSLLEACFFIPSITHLNTSSFGWKINSPDRSLSIHELRPSTHPPD